VLAGHELIEVVALIDRDAARASDLARAYGIARTETDLSSITPAEFDGVVVATPPAHHAPAVLQLVGQGLHVFVEKPMAIRASDAQSMASAAAAAGVALSVGLYRRLLPVSRLLRGLLESEAFGRPLAADVEEGGEYTWDLATLAGLTREGGGGGPLIDLGSHLIDQLLFVIPGQATVVEYADNARGGIETDCEARLSIESRWGPVPARIEFSRTRQLRGTLRVSCERGTLEIVRSDFCRLRIEPTNPTAPDDTAGKRRSVELSARWADEGDIIGYKAFREEFDDWLRAIRDRTSPQLSGASAVPVVELIERCYATALPLAEPWVDEPLPELRRRSGQTPLISGRPGRLKVLVTGAGGFLGSRTAELLHGGGSCDVRALVRRPASAARLARLPLEVVLGDVCSPDDMRRAVAGCDAVVHCAVGTDWPPEAAFKVTVGGTAAVARAALEAGVRRFVHISSMAVHGNHPPANLDESVSLDPGTGTDYGRAKYLAEQAVWDAAKKGLSAIALRPARIYGPWSRTFTVRPLTALHTNSLVLRGDADTPANMVYVDNVAAAIFHALAAPEGTVGQAFMISDPDQLSWRAFYEYFAAAVGAGVLIQPRGSAGDPGAAKASWLGRWVEGGKQVVFSTELRGLAKKVMWTDPFGVWPRRIWERSPNLQRRVLGAMGVDAAVVYREPRAPEAEQVVFEIDPTLVVIDKAVRELGYSPVVSTARSMELTRDWGRWARLL
jgi:nucleoside-diphosphate-sugar epimerase/predicted dehydrogenase